MVVFFTAGAAATVIFNTIASIVSAAKANKQAHVQPKQLKELQELAHLDVQG